LATGANLSSAADDPVSRRWEAVSKPVLAHGWLGRDSGSSPSRDVVSDPFPTVDPSHPPCVPRKIQSPER